MSPKTTCFTASTTSGCSNLDWSSRAAPVCARCAPRAAGRFSTDLDFCAPSDGLAALVMDAIDNAIVPPFRYVLAERNDGAGRAALRVTAPFGPNPADHASSEIRIASKVEFSPRQPWLEPETLPFLALPVHRSYDLPHGLPALPVVRVEEAIAEKLARYARVGLARDLYDLVWYGRQGRLAEELIRRLWILKVYQDVVVDGRWSNRPFDPAAVLAPRSAAEIDDENIGYLTQPIDVAGWEREYRQRYRFLAHLTEEERTWAACHAGRRFEFTQAVLAL